jgi:hypothetical protein
MPGLSLLGQAVGVLLSFIGRPCRFALSRVHSVLPPVAHVLSVVLGLSLL